jgi:hypothetical protein
MKSHLGVHWPMGVPLAPVGRMNNSMAFTHFAVDPSSPCNRDITDLHFAPRGDNSLVRFAADVRIPRPVEPQRGNHRLLLDVPNRGNRLALWMFNHAPRPAVPSAPLDPGNGFLMRQGYTIVWCG